MSTHTTGIQQLCWSPDGRYLFSAGGREEFFVWKVQSIPNLEVGIVLIAKCPTVSDSADLRIMSISVVPISPKEPQRFRISMAYSDSSLRIWAYDSNTLAFALISSTSYTTSCLTQTATLDLATAPSLLTASTDGHIALWPLFLHHIPVPSPRFEFPYSALQPFHLLRHRIHQSSIKALAVFKVSSTDALLATGGDDNALAFTRISRGAATGGDGLAPMCATLLIPKAHAAAINAVLWLPNTNETLSKGDTHLLSASNDQILKLWRVSFALGGEDGEVDLGVGVKEIGVELVNSWESSVADVSCLGLLRLKRGTEGDGQRSGKGETEGPKGVEWRVVAAGIGVEVWTLSEKGFAGTPDL